jgi:hypothetical protein
VDRTEVDLGVLAEGVVLGHAHFDERQLLAPAGLGHVAAHGGLTDVDAVLIRQALPYPSRRVALLAGGGAVGLEPCVDGRLPWAEHWGVARRDVSRRWQRGHEGPANVSAVHAEAPGQLSDKRLFAIAGLTDLSVELHLQPLGHAPTVGWTTAHLVDPPMGHGHRGPGERHDEQQPPPERSDF